MSSTAQRGTQEPARASGSARPSAGAARQPEIITSRDNRWLKRFRAAFSGDAAKSSSSSSSGEAEIAAIEGSRIVEAALEAARSPNGVEIVAVLASESGTRHLARLAPLIPESAPALHTTDRLFAQIAATEAPHGIAALVRPRAAAFDDLVCGVPLVLVLAGVQDPGNVGVLLRTAEALGATGAAACAAAGIGTANPFGPKALRASAGAALRLPILRAASASVFMAQLRLAGIKLFAACPDDAAAAAAEPPLSPWEIDWRGPVALLVGNEGAGLPADVVRSADRVVRIPQVLPREPGAPAPESLNAAVAGGVLLYEAARQRGLR